jgi:hypothetical protein
MSPCRPSDEAANAARQGTFRNVAGHHGGTGSLAEHLEGIGRSRVTAALGAKVDGA